MTYELAKKLKDAGFPQKENNSQNWDEPTMRFYYSPTLSELIKACGNKFGVLQLADLRKNSKSRWYASTIVYVENPAYGKTPEEAVAKLWLELNKK